MSFQLECFIRLTSHMLKVVHAHSSGSNCDMLLKFGM